MDQFEYDVTEFVLNNRESIVQFLYNETNHLHLFRTVFSEDVSIYEELLLNFQKSKLLKLLSECFPNEFEKLLLIVDDNFVKMVLNYKGDFTC